MVRERLNHGFSGWLMLVVCLAVLVGAPYLTYLNAAPRRPPLELILAIPLFVFLAKGFFKVSPNEGVVMQLFGSYVGTAKVPGLRWTNPFYSKRKISQRVRNFESSHLKVNDKEANPIEIAAVIVWRVVETAEATFEVDDYQNYNEAPGALVDATGALYPPADQVFRRKVTITKGNLSVIDLGTPFSGLTVKVIVTAPTGQQWVFQRFIPEPAQ